ncbi:ferredoxin [Micromonospora cathayae]|uniref:Ferredoxin n=1 Tax=Micromonospora cathayae TaxID=3028804 RepID=A0ABY7ZL96_9ACTN|nr:ferredoxin [Micromonospora sp. HUAS 3]WDZ83551.1 ferredoxin [Micromonospora sp. HUAS 3]
MRITVDQDRCCGSGQCALAAPDVFDQRDEDGVVVLLNPSPAAERLADVTDAAAVCPASAITVEP